MIEEGSKVTIHYTLEVDGELIDSSRQGEPLTYVQGSGQIIPGLEEAISEMKQGEETPVVVPPEKAYGVRNSEAFKEVPKDAFNKLENLKVGDRVKGQFGDQPFEAQVSSIDDSNVTLDFNHPLAGKTLHFNIEVLSVQSQ